MVAWLQRRGHSWDVIHKIMDELKANSWFYDCLDRHPLSFYQLGHLVTLKHVLWLQLAWTLEKQLLWFRLVEFVRRRVNASARHSIWRWMVDSHHFMVVQLCCVQCMCVLRIWHAPQHIFSNTANRLQIHYACTDPLCFNYCFANLQHKALS